MTVVVDNVGVGGTAVVGVTAVVVAGQPYPLMPNAGMLEVPQHPNGELQYCAVLL